MCATNEMTYTVEGMACGSCELSVRDEVEEVAGVTSVRADRATGAIVVVGEGSVDVAVRAAVAEAGYRVAA